MKRAHPEDDLQMLVADYLRYKCPTILWFHVPNGGKRNAREGARFKRMGVLPGVADILLFWRTPQPDNTIHMGAIELKAGKNTQEDSQRNFEQAWKYRGGQYAVCRSLEQAQEALRQWGALPVTKCPTAYAMGSLSPEYVKPKKKGAKSD